MAVSSPIFAACTIVASNYLARALVLHDSLVRQHPDADFWLLLIDDAPLGPLSQAAIDKRGIHVLRVDGIGLPPEEIARFRMIYDVTEISTAYKPWTMEAVVKLTGRHVFYIDPDIEFFAPMTTLVEAVDTHDLVLTPHVLHPMKRDGAQPSEADIMGSGIYNLGFLGMNRRAGKVTAWWSERLKRECYSAPAQQRFTDQRWMDFAPALFECHISKDETFNVAYWNADERPVVQANGTYSVNGRPLSFFHYSGLNERTPHLLTRHHAGCPRVLLSDHPALVTLTENYVAAIGRAQAECADTTADYPFNSFPGGGKISISVRRAILAELDSAEKEGRSLPPSPFDSEGEGRFLSWIKETILTKGGRVPVPRLFLLLRQIRDDLKSAFPDPCGRDAVRMVEWFCRDGAKQFQIPRRMLPDGPLPEQPPTPGKLVPGLEIIGYLRTESGVGQAARLLAKGLKGSGVPYATLEDSSPPSRQRDPFQQESTAVLAKDESFDCCVLCVNADSVASVRRRLGRPYFRGRRTAGLWFWELEMFPEKLHTAFDEVDEVWVASEFIRGSLSKVSPVPVHYIPLPFGIAEPAPPLDRTTLGIPGGFYFLFSFDFHSVFRRKNPLGVIEAFKKAFQPGEGPSLVIKGINADSHLVDLEHLRHAARDRDDIVILADYLDAAVNQSLTAGCGCYVSLHRSEGLGLTMAEAMRQRKPVIATAYSGNMDFMNGENSYLCRFEMQPVGQGAAPYPASAVWAEPDVVHAAELMRHVFANPGEAAEKGAKAAESLAQKFNPALCAEAVNARLNALRSAQSVKRSNDVMKDVKPSSLSVPVKSLRKHVSRPLDVTSTVPSTGSLLFQGPQKILRKMLQRIERHRKPFDEAIVETASNHDARIAALERALNELRRQNEALLKAQEGGRSGSDDEASS